MGALQSGARPRGVEWAVGGEMERKRERGWREREDGGGESQDGGGERAWRRESEDGGEREGMEVCGGRKIKKLVFFSSSTEVQQVDNGCRVVSSSLYVFSRAN